MHPILVTGGAGYIGLRTCVALIGVGYTPVVVDNYSNSSPEAIIRVQQLTNRTIAHYEADICYTRHVSRRRWQQQNPQGYS